MHQPADYVQHPADTAVRYIGMEALGLCGDAAATVPASQEYKLCYSLRSKAAVSILRDHMRLRGSADCGELFLVPPGYSCTLSNVTGLSAAVYVIRFTCAEASVLNIDLHRFHCVRMPQALNWMNDFAASQERCDTALGLLLHSYLYAMLSALVAAADDEPQGTRTLAQYIEQTRLYMARQYVEPIDVEEIAKLSGAGSSRFYQAFKQRTGLTPHKYITKIRLDASLELLAKQMPVGDVAHFTGYADEYYFSRMFKKQMGMTPSEYAQRTKLRVANLSPVFAGDLSVLGITPVLSLPYGWSRQPEAALAQLRRSEPELIVTSPVAPAIAEGLYRELNNIAPTVVLYWKKYSWRNRFLEIAWHLGLSPVASRWLAYYDAKAENGRSHVRSKLGDAPYLLVLASESQFRVYGLHLNILNDVFYNDLRVIPPDPAHGFSLLELASLEEVAALDCGNVLFLADNSCSEPFCRMLEDTWKKLKQGDRQPANCVVIRHGQKLLYNAAEGELLIDQTVEQLLDDNSLYA